MAINSKFIRNTLQLRQFHISFRITYQNNGNKMTEMPSENFQFHSQAAAVMPTNMHIESAKLSQQKTARVNIKGKADINYKFKSQC